MVGLIRLFRYSKPELTHPKPEDISAAAMIVQKSGSAASNLALLEDKFYLFNANRTSFIMFGVQGRSWVSMGNPVGPEAEWPELIWRFRELTDRYGGWTVFYEIPGEAVHYYMELGLTVTKLGEEARVHIPDFSMEGGRRKELRRNCRKFKKEGYRFEMVSQERVPDILPQLKKISDAWLNEKNTLEKRFSLGCFSPAYLSRFQMATIQKDGKIIAFANIWQSTGKEEISVDLMRYHPEIAPGGIMDFMFTELISWSSRQNYKWFNLGMAPLTGLEDHFLAPLWNRLAAFVADHGDHFYNFNGLRQYKNKFGPVWRPNFLISPGGLALPQVLIGLLSLISGTLKGSVSK